MKDQKSLKAILQEKQESKTQDKKPDKETENRPDSRKGKKILQGWYPAEVHRQVRLLAANQDVSMERIIGDALNLLFEQNNIPPLA